MAPSTTVEAGVLYKVETKGRIARWTVHTNDKFIDRDSTKGLSSMDRPSHVFKMGNSNWKLYFVNSVSTIDGVFCFGLDPVNSISDHVMASFSIRVICNNQIYDTTFQDGLLTRVNETNSDGSLTRVNDAEKFYSDKVYWRAIIGSFTGEFMVEVEFVNLSIANRKTGEVCIIWSRDLTRKQIHQNSLITSIGRMLSENIYTDVTIMTSDGGKFNAHRAILASRSSVFHTMFSHDLQEKELSTIDMSDISTGACKALLEYIYGSMKGEDLMKHLFELVRVADKYDIPELLHECEERLTDDIDRKNVLEKLQTANLYGLPELKSRCLKYLVKFGKIIEISKDDLDEFVQNSDKEHIADILCEILKEWKTIRTFGNNMACD